VVAAIGPGAGRGHGRSGAPGSRAGSTRRSALGGPAGAARWKQATTIWLVCFPPNLLATVTLGRLLEGVPVALRVPSSTRGVSPRSACYLDGVEAFMARCGH
jgi:hypothetical protein